MPIPLFQGFGKVIAFRLKRPKQKGRTQHNSTTTNHEGINSIPANISNHVPVLIPSSISSLVHHVFAITESGLEASVDLSSARSVGGVSLAREASDMAQVALPFVQAIASAIPLVGAPMQAAISGLLTGLQAIDRRSQNKSDLDALTSRLNRLCLNLCNAPPARDPAEQYRRDSFVRMLQGTSARVATLRERCLASTPVTQAIAGCFMDIDRYLADYLVWSFQIHNQHDIHEELTILQRQQEDHNKLLITIQSMMIHSQSSMGPSASPAAIALGCVTLVDATGHHHAISVNCCTSYQQLNDMLKVLFQRDAIEAQIQRRYIEQGEYDLCIDEGTQVTCLTSHEWSSIEAGTKIVMRAILHQETSTSSEVDYKCRFCGAVNRLGIRSVKYWSQGGTVCSTDCRECKRRFQITRALVDMSLSRESSNSDSNHTTDAETRLIRNFHVQQVSVRDLVFQASQRTLTVPRSCPALSRRCVISCFELLSGR
ncbi:hypothetical protein EDD22DRAFT_961185 [Suillus occidentalis]|nr:hypothetical protein EDD22DRAFT_961185 [Suillus occidentalis]